MNTIGLLENPIQNYAWGSETAIAALLGKQPTGAPQAELWMGAHPKSPSRVIFGGKSFPLPDLISNNPVEILGKSTAEKYNGRLPYLLKVLAAARPLSIQAHPNLAQAERGYNRENKLGIALTAGDRNYRDANHKPECLCALTPFWALSGFRRIDKILMHLERICPKGLEKALDALRQDGLKRFFYTLMTVSDERKQQIIDEAVFNAQQLAGRAPCYQWVVTLHRAYPTDIGILSPLCLNIVCLKPGEAMFLGAGELHAYLDGLGMELMANSDNVLRGGLTPKHMDIPELLKVLTFNEKDIEILTPEALRPGERMYVTPADEFSLSVIHVSKTLLYTSPEKRSVEIIFCTDGAAELKVDRTNDTLSIRKGLAFLVPAAAPAYNIYGDATIYKASVPLSVQP